MNNNTVVGIDNFTMPDDDNIDPALREARQLVLADNHRAILELAARGAPVRETLNAVVRAARDLRGPECRAAVFIFDPESALLRFAAATGLEEGYTCAIDGFPIGANQPSCGKAAFTGLDVIVRDVATDAQWAPLRALAEQYGIRACWSFLLKDADGKVLGTFALYHADPCEPNARDYREVGYFANIAALLIGRHASEQRDTAAQQSVEHSLRDANRHKDEFLATLAHELRNPLSAIKNALSVAQLARDQSVPRERALEAMARQLTQMEWLIEDLIDANRIARGEMKLQLKLVELKPALELAVETVMPQCRRDQQVLTVSMPVVAIELEADPTRLAQMVTNLLNNASKFTDKGGTIEIRAALEDGDVVISVRDNGIGIAHEKLEQIFDMFVQADHAGVRAAKGMGIGLSLVRNLAQMHGGSIRASSAGLGHGSEFVLRIPARQPA